MKKFTILFIIISAVLFAQGIDEANKLRLAQSYESSGNYEKALEFFKELYNLRKDDFAYYDGYLKNLMNLKRYPEAISLTKSQLAKNSLDFGSYGLLAVLYYKIDRIDSMNYVIDKALEIEKKNFITYRTISNVLLENRLFDKAIEVLELGKKNCSEKISFLFDLSNLYVTVMNYKNACELLVEILKFEPNQYYYVENKLSTIAYKNEGLKTALNIFSSASEDNTNLAIDRCYGWLLFASKDFKKAFDLIVKIDERSNGNGTEIVNFAQRAYNEKEFEVAIESYSYLIKKFNNQKDIKAFSILGLAKCYEDKYLKTQAESKDSWKNLRMPISENNLELENALNNYMIILKDYTGTTFVPEAIFRSAKIRLEYYNNFQSARNDFNKLILDFAWSEFNIRSLYYLGKLSVFENKYDEAIDLYSRIKYDNRATEEDKAKTNFHISQVFILKSNLDTAKVLLAESIKNIYLEISNDILELLFQIQESEDSKDNLAKFIKAKIYLESKNYDAAEKIFEELSKSKTENSIIEQSFLELADIKILKNDYSGALSNLVYIVNLKEKGFFGDKAQFKLGEVYYYGINNQQAALENFEKLLINYPNSLLINKTRTIIEEIKNLKILN